MTKHHLLTDFDCLWDVFGITTIQQNCEKVLDHEQEIIFEGKWQTKLLHSVSLIRWKVQFI